MEEKVERFVEGEFLERTEKFKVFNESDVPLFIKQKINEYTDEKFIVVSYSSTKKEKKEKGEVVDEWWVLTFRVKEY